MSRSLAVAALLGVMPCTALSAGAAPPVGVRLPTAAELQAVVSGGDEVEIERVARRMGAARLARIVTGARGYPVAPNDTRGLSSRAERLAALRALPLTDGAWATLAILAVVLGDGDREVGEAAAVAVTRIADALTPAVVFAEEIPRDVPRLAGRALASAAGKRELTPAIRTAALAAASTLSRLGTGAPIDAKLLDALLVDPEPRVRRAAVEALDVRNQAALLERALADTDGAVAAAAGVALCASVPPTTSKAPSEKAASALAEPARARLRTLATDESIGLADRLDLIPCLRAFATPGDRKLLDGLARSPVESIKRRARAYGGR